MICVVIFLKDEKNIPVVALNDTQSSLRTDVHS